MWETYMHRRKAKEGVENTDGKEKEKENENEKEKEKQKEQLNFEGQHDDELWETVILEDYMAKGKATRRRVRSGRLEGLEATRARAGELDRSGPSSSLVSSSGNFRPSFTTPPSTQSSVPTRAV